MKIYNELTQGSDEWGAIRLGKITASNFSKVMAKGAGKTRQSYLYKLAAEIITGDQVDHYTNDAMLHGTETEPMARAAYCFENDIEVTEVGFIETDEYLGCSPDGLVGDDGLVEIKCPVTTTQIATFLSGRMPTTHKAQVQGQIWISEKSWCDFVSFDPRVNGKASYFCERIYRDDDYIKTLEIEVEKFKNELIEIIGTLKG